MGRPRQSELEEQENETEDAAIVEGGEPAYQKVRKLLENVRNSKENQEQRDVILYQKGKTKESKDKIETYEFDFDTPIDEISAEIVDRADEDIRDQEEKSIKYLVEIDDMDISCMFTLKWEDGDEDDMDDITDTPNRKGLMGLLMRHQQGTYKLSVVQAAKMIDKLSESLDKKDAIIADLQKQQVINLKTYEEMLSGKHMRDLELRKMENSDRRMDQLAGTVLQGFPLLVGKFLGGGAGAVKMQEAPGARTGMEALVEGFIRTLDGEQFNKIVQSGLFNPVQIAGLVEIVKFVMEREEEEVKQRAAANGSTQQGTPNQPQPPANNAQAPT
jgi:hypothetical protein